MNHCTKEQLIGFENRIRDIFAAGELPFLVHLSGGNEKELIEIFKEVHPGDWLFSGHRSHYHYLLSGGTPENLEQFIRDGNSMFVFDNKINFLASSILAGTACIAAGVAHQLKMEGSPNRVWCFLGDGAEDEGHFYEAVNFVDGHNLPCTFVIEDNDRSVDTNKEQRRGENWVAWPNCVRRYHYTSTFPHGGAGLTTIVKFKPEIVEKFAGLAK